MEEKASEGCWRCTANGTGATRPEGTGTARSEGSGGTTGSEGSCRATRPEGTGATRAQSTGGAAHSEGACSKSSGGGPKAGGWATGTTSVRPASRYDEDAANSVEEETGHRCLEGTSERAT